MVAYLAQQYLDDSEKLFSGRIAVTCDGFRISYGELVRSSNRLANCLIRNGIHRQDRVALCLGRSINSIIAVAGILKADAVYVPVDSKWPVARLAKIIDDCRPSALICDGGTGEQALQAVSKKEGFPKILLMDDRMKAPSFSKDSLICREEIEDQDSDCPRYGNIDADMAYILYTSGSAGSPKGVMISHLNITNYIEWAVDRFQITKEDRVLSTAPFHFDMSTFDIYCSFKSGAALCVASESERLFPGKLLDLIEREEITVWKGVSSLLMYMAQGASLGRRKLPTLKRILFGGESLPTKHLIEWMNAYPEKLFYNVYGPTEATGISTCYPVEEIPKDPLVRIPIGRACRNTEVFLLKEDGSLAGVGEAGELYVRGSGLSRGYWNDREKTEKAFITNPLTKTPGDRVYRTGDRALQRKDGNYEFLGRKDDQVKYLGYRIELLEIENAILSVEEVKDAAVTLIPGEKIPVPEIVALTVLKNQGNPGEILAELRNKLPRYMLPQKILRVTRIPRTDRGKIDRQALPTILSKVEKDPMQS